MFFSVLNVWFLLLFLHVLLTGCFCFKDVGDADRDHEELVKTHLTSRINELTKQVSQLKSWDIAINTCFHNCLPFLLNIFLALLLVTDIWAPNFHDSCM